MNKAKGNNQKRLRRTIRTRKAVKSTLQPRLSVFRSNRYIYAQLIDDAQGITLAAASSHQIKDSKTKTDTAKEVGKLIAKQAGTKGITQVVFDRGQYRYHGRVKAVADSARENGLKF